MCGYNHPEDNEYAFKNRPWMDPRLDQREADQAYTRYWREKEEGSYHGGLTEWELENSPQ